MRTHSPIIAGMTAREMRVWLADHRRSPVNMFCSATVPSN
jgi:hypothetical protein